MSAQRARSVIAADHRSALPHVPGLPWWGAALLAATATAVGFAYDAGTGDKALSAAFSLCYVLGCVLAVLAVRQSGVFSAVIQPPLILFVSVPFAYFVFHGSTITGIKDTLINCGYPLIERFPLMFFTSAAVLLIGMVRWYLGTAGRRAIAADADETTDDAPAEGLLGGVLASKATKSTKKTTKARRTPRTTTDRPDRAAAAAALASDEDSPRPPRRERTAAPAARKPARTPRSRHSLPPETEVIEPVPSRPRRRPSPPVEPPAEPRRRPRAAEPREPRERRPLPPLDRRSGPERPDRYDRPQRRERPDVRERAERPEYPDRADRPDRPQRRPRSSEDLYDSRPPSSSNGGSGSHHPVSRVRYRGSDDGESRTEHRTRPRRPRHAEAESWEFDA